MSEDKQRHKRKCRRGYTRTSKDTRGCGEARAREDAGTSKGPQEHENTRMHEDVHGCASVMVVVEKQGGCECPDACVLIFEPRIRFIFQTQLS